MIIMGMKSKNLCVSAFSLPQPQFGRGCEHDQHPEGLEEGGSQELGWPLSGALRA